MNVDEIVIFRMRANFDNPSDVYGRRLWKEMKLYLPTGVSSNIKSELDDNLLFVKKKQEFEVAF